MEVIKELVLMVDQKVQELDQIIMLEVELENTDINHLQIDQLQVICNQRDLLVHDLPDQENDQIAFGMIGSN